MLQASVGGLLLAVLAHAAAQSVQIRSQGDGGLQSLPNGAVVAWNTRGDIQVRDPGGTWGPVHRLATQSIQGASARNGLVYIRAQVVDVRTGAVEPQFFSVRPDGTIVKIAAPSDGDTIVVARRGLPPIRCSPEDASKASYHAPTCESDSPRWKVFGSWTVEPFACGEALVERSHDDLTARSLTDGHVLAKTAVPAAASVACDGSGLLVGTDRIVALDPTTLRPTWSVHAKAHPITALCAVGKEIVYFTPAGPRSSPRPDRR